MLGNPLITSYLKKYGLSLGSCRRSNGLWIRKKALVYVLNNERPHEALNMKCPAEIYQHSTRASAASPLRRFYRRKFAAAGLVASFFKVRCMRS